MPSFAELSLLPTLVASLRAEGFKTPTEVQQSAIPPLLDGQSVVAVSETGSGKTLAYALPLLHRLKTLENEGSTVSIAGRPRGLVMVPGRELGEQVGRVLKSLTHQTRLRVRMVLGGSAKKVARQNVAGKFEVLVATPGRLTQLVDSGELSLKDVRTVVFDEADQLLDSGFLPVARSVVAACPKNAQLVLFSATLPASLERAVSSLFRTPPQQIRTRRNQQVVSTLSVENRATNKAERYDELGRVLRERTPTGMILFVNTRKHVDRLAEWLTAEGVSFVQYRGQMDRLERRQNLKAFRNGDVQALVTTDLGGRGLDIERVDWVINVHLPEDLESYLHRVGRTARAGRSGNVVNLVTQRDHPLLAQLKKRAAEAPDGPRR